MAKQIERGMRVALPVDYAGVSMAMTKRIIERGAGDLHLICVPTGGLQVDQLVGAGLVRTVETSAVSLGEAGGAPRFNEAVREGAIRVMDATCPAIHAGLMAAQKGSPFVPMRGLIGTDVLRYRSDWRVIDNPFAEAGDPIVLIPAIRPDIAVFHAPVADRFGNVWIGRRRELAAMAYASAKTIVTVERVVEESLLLSETTAAGTLPAIYVTAVAHAPKGAWPYGLWGEYPTDTAELLRYASAARTANGFADYMRADAMEPAQ
ncbi:CoA transferase [Mesorhizobium sp.]|uniref:CoA transferase subunit A n=1 Tax=Mesorhizobium sp. TaxID=1871066 RepID=UPI000FE6575B|nr:CoA transferase [Mesorhizobium sp.]RWB06569.1 MAG: CoA synthetase [Mesorhizobium sp.]RWO32576.1 MAG: CoA synthetase [Mesorhizobium sp.]RWP69606.1 MAG: CoA synthetase [Mesorhizobium sp.]RWQ02909.1 MAG: CoA synthetase [Mesorhizobium sp.]RWQ44691.1 MAG: CoA synthetase [Mesorhizobium sp.]